MLGEEVQRDGGKLRRGTPLQKEDAIVRRDPEQGAEGFFRARDDLRKLRGAMAHLQHGHTGIPVAKKGISCGLQDFERKHGGPGGKIIHSFHQKYHIAPDARHLSETYCKVRILYPETPFLSRSNPQFPSDADFFAIRSGEKSLSFFTKTEKSPKIRKTLQNILTFAFLRDIIFQQGLRHPHFPRKRRNSSVG